VSRAARRDAARLKEDQPPANRHDHEPTPPDHTQARESAWPLRLLEKHVALAGDIPDLDHSAIGRVLKKRSFVLI